MARVLSFLLATLLVLSAAAEVASFAIDNKSWILENLKAIGSYVTADRGTERSRNLRRRIAAMRVGQRMVRPSFSRDATMSSR